MAEFFSKLGGLVLWVIKAVLVFAGIAAVVALLPALAMLDDQRYRISSSAASAWITLISLGILLVLLCLAARWMFRLLATPPGTWNLFGDSAAARLIGLGIVVALFSKAIVSLITVPIQVLVQLFVDIPRMVTRLSPPGQVDSQSVVLADHIAMRLILLLQGLGLEIGKALSQLFSSLSVSEVVLALALWVIVGQLLSTPAGAAPAGTAAPTAIRLIAYFQNLTDTQRRYLWIGAVFFFGLYLSIAAIVAIPWLQDDKAPQNLTPQKLEESLLTLVPKADETESTPAAGAAVSTPADPLVQLDEALNQAGKRLATLPKTEADGRGLSRAAFLIEDVRQTMGIARVAREDLRDRSRQLRDQVRQRRGQVVKEAVNAFASEVLSPMSSQERAVFFRDIQRSVQNQVADMQQALQDCGRALSDVEKQIDFFVRDASAALSSPDLGASFGSRAGALGLFSSARGCSAVSLGAVQYVTPDPGASWGPFTLVAQWLLRTKSQALALITGMLGFGLFGAAIATFVRPPSTSGDSSPAGDAATTMIRGLSAAIVIFLAVKGGLAIVSNSEAELNAYVLFFVCLVGAVFSEGVWKWAKGKLDGILSNGATNSDAQGGKGSGGSSGTTPEGAGMGTPPPTTPTTPPANTTPP